jgi:tRNA-uridine 2-sulfurtransferase
MIENIETFNPMPEKSDSLAVIAMSGGVDSSVAALLLHQRGIKSLGISMQVWDYRKNGGCSSKATCCAPDDFTDARSVAASIGIPYYVFDFETSFREKVIDNFVNTYYSGETPNPCIDCNTKVKFKELLGRALALGCTHIATGHYAQIKKSSLGYHLLRGADNDKDQSYFLYGLTQEELACTLFPVGHLVKNEVRALAQKAGLVNASKPESQDICFISGSVKDFIIKIRHKNQKKLEPQPDQAEPVHEQYLTQKESLTQKRGTIQNTRKVILGFHDGIQHFTVGQRRGLHIGGNATPLYVLSLDKENNIVYVGEKKELEREVFYVHQLNIINPVLNKRYQSESFPIVFESLVQVRSRHRGTLAEVSLIDKDTAKVQFIHENKNPDTDKPIISPGQAAVFYSLENIEALGGGRIRAF